MGNKKNMNNEKINDEGLRLLSNIEAHYDNWLQAERIIKEGSLQWKKSGGNEYLYRINKKTNSGISLGPKNFETEKMMDAYKIAKKTSVDTWEKLILDGRIYKALKLPKILSYSGKFLRELDIEKILGNSIMVVGTNALCVYAVEGMIKPNSDLDTTEDFDITWIKKNSENLINNKNKTLFEILKEIDSTYTINTERTFQARNSNGNEIELLIPEKLTNFISKYEQFKPIPLFEQNWLLLGRKISHVVCGFDGLPARVVAPDPRLFALHKLWLSDKKNRNTLKKEKDKAQGEFVLKIVKNNMPDFPLDSSFEKILPNELKIYLKNWLRQNQKLVQPYN